MHLFNRWSYLAFAGLLAAAAPLVAVAAWPGLRGSATPPSAGSNREAISGGAYSASWAVGYDTIPALAAASDLVVVANVTTHRQFAQDQLLFTDFTVTVTTPIKGEADSVIVVMQTGGYDSQGRLHEMDDDPMFADTASYLLFLVKDPNSPKYYVAGGPAGRFVVAGDQIRSLSAAYAERKIFDTGIDGMPLAAAIRQVTGQP